MTAHKDRAIRELITRLDLTSKGWVMVDHWEADLQAIGIAAKRDPRRLVYVSTFSGDQGRFDYQCETPMGPDDVDYSTTASGENVGFDALLRVLETHLG
jgi:hypothetical protein